MEGLSVLSLFHSEKDRGFELHPVYPCMHCCVCVILCKQRSSAESRSTVQRVLGIDMYRTAFVN